MTPFAKLSAIGKLRRLRQLAAAALDRYDIEVASLEFHCFATNLMYRVTTASGERFVLRLAVPGWRALEDLQSEVMWLDALARETSIPVPQIVRTCDDHAVLPVKIPSVPEPWNATLMTWVPGRLMGHYLTPANLQKMGELFANLHRHGAEWARPDGFTKRRFIGWLSRGEENVLVGDGAVPARDTRTDELIARLDDHVHRAYATVDPADVRVIHCDLWHDNIKVQNGVLNPFDFEDTILGYRSHDIAMAMLDLLEAVGDADYPPLVASFRAGYERRMAWPVDPIEPFQVGRLLWKLNWIGRNRPDWFQRSVQRYGPVFERYAATGRLSQLPD